jgi:hypothetical protein
MAEDKNTLTDDAHERGGGKMSEAEIDSNLNESFPASDPPSWTLGTDHSDAAPAQPTAQPAPDGDEE